MSPGLSVLALALTQGAPVPLDVHGYVDAYDAFNFNRPSDGSNFIPGQSTAAVLGAVAAL